MRDVEAVHIFDALTNFMEDVLWVNSDIRGTMLENDIIN
jgi:hypothetical protein